MNDDIKITALAKILGVSEESISDEGHDRYSSTDAPGEYWVLTDDEADQAWDESLDQYLDDCVLDGLPEIARNYFDSEKWKRDAKFDGRGHSLASYDGTEHETKIDDEWFYAYRVN